MAITVYPDQVIKFIDASHLDDLINEINLLREEIKALKSNLPVELSGLLTLQDVANYLGVKSDQTARTWCHKNGVKLHKIGVNTRVLGEDVYNTIQRHKNGRHGKK